MRRGRKVAPARHMEGHQTSGLTSRLILDYVERERGRQAVDRVLAICGLSEREEQLRDENHWFGFGTKIDLFEAAAEVLDDPAVALHIGQAALDLNVAAGLKLALRAFGSPRLIYANVVRASAKFSWAHTWEVLHLSEEHARLRYRDVSNVGYHRLDCQYNQGLLSCAPLMFGMAPAEVDHPLCALDGAEHCTYDVRWEERANRALPAAALGLLTAATVGPAALAAPALLPAALAVPAAGAAVVSYLEHHRLRRANRSLHSELREQREVSSRLSGSLQDLVSDLRFDEVLAKITANASAAIGGKEFVLLLKDVGGGCEASASRLPRELLSHLERWAERTSRVFEAPMTVDSLVRVPELEPIAFNDRLPLGSLCAAPLRFRDRRLGALVALAHGPQAFLPQDAALLESYAAQAAIALSNARLVDRLERLASQDPLTELLNHREFHQAAERELKRCERRSDESFSIVLLDLDGFKRVNDERGHIEGDSVLRDVAATLRASCRGSDLAFRVGGDEFALLLPGARSAQALDVARRLEEEIAAFGPSLGVSYGVAEWPADGPSKDLLLLRADMAMYSHKAERQSNHALQVQDVRVSGKARAAHRRVVLDRLVRQACEAVEAEIGAIFVRDGVDLTKLVGVAGHGVPSSLLAPRDVRSGLPGEVLRTGEPVVLDDYREFPTRAKHETLADIRAAVGVPLRLAGVVRGVICVGTRDPEQRFGERAVRMLSEIADMGAVALENAEMHERLDRTVQAGVEAIALAVDLRDSYTAQHSEHVVELACSVGERLGLERIGLLELEFGARLHDLGKIGIPDAILRKPEKLTAEEWEVMKRHSAWGEEILKRLPGLERVAGIVRFEHERWDGSGYPDGLAGEEIPLASRVIAPCDAYHAMTSDRAYRPALSNEVAVGELLAGAGTQFDPSVIQVLVEVLGHAASLTAAVTPAPV